MFTVCSGHFTLHTAYPDPISYGYLFQHSAAQHSTAQHSIAHRLTAQHSTALVGCHTCDGGRGSGSGEWNEMLMQECEEALCGEVESAGMEVEATV